MLEDAGFRTIEAGSGREAVAQARAHAPDLIMLDLSIPDGDGRWVLEQLQSDAATAAIPVVVVTGTPADAPATSGPVIAKPFDRSELVATVRRLLHGRPNARVLVADDDDDARHVLRETLQRHGCDVIEAASGRDVLNRLGEEPFDLVFLDLHMSHVYGRDIIRALRNPLLTQRVPIIVVSGSDGERQTLQSLVLGANAFMARSPDASALAREAERLLHA
jgi:CheY-like chemotaxis protein